MAIETMQYFIAGKEFPSQSMAKRQSEILENKKLYDSKQCEIYLDALLNRLDLAGVEHRRYYSDGKNSRISAVDAKSIYEDIFVAINAHKPIIQTYSTLLFGEGLQVADKNTDRNTWLNGDTNQEDSEEMGWLQRENFSGKAYKTGIGGGQTGSGVFKIWVTEEGKAKLTTVPGERWFPVISSWDENLIIADLEVTKFKIDKKLFDNYNLSGEYTSSKNILKVVEYEVGKNTYRLFMCDGNKVISQIPWDEANSKYVGEMPQGVRVEELDLVQETGYNYSMIQRYPFQEDETHILGKPLYSKSTKSSERDLCIRSTQIERILDKNSDPGMAIPETALEEDQNGNIVAQTQGKAMIVAQGDPTPEYIEFSGHLESNFMQITKHWENIYRETRTNGAILGATVEGIGILSGTAFEQVYAPILAAVQVMKMFIDPVLNRVLKLAYQIENGADELQPEIIYNDGLPKSKIDEIQEIRAMNGELPVMSHTKSIMLTTGMSEEEAKQEVERINKELQANVQPVVGLPPVFGE